MLIDHAVMICHKILEDAYAPAELPQLEGALVRKGDAVTTSARLEGLLAALTFLPSDHPIVPHIRAAVNRGIDFVLRAQVKDGPHAGGVPYAISTLPSNLGGDAKFNQNAKTKIQIDHFQHSVSALARYLALRNAGTSLKKKTRPKKNAPRERGIFRRLERRIRRGGGALHPDPAGRDRAASSVPGSGTSVSVSVSVSAGNSFESSEPTLPPLASTKATLR